MSVTYDPTRYHDHAEMTAILQDLAERFPRLVELESIGRSWDGKDIWAVTVTNRERGAPGDKPAVYVDGGIDPREVVGCAAALHLVHRLVRGHGASAGATELLDGTTFYVLPCVNPYGVDAVMHRPVLLPGTRPPAEGGEDVLLGVDRRDLDGDGRVLRMRVADPDGEWRVSDHDPRLMVRRLPWEPEPAYRVLDEGCLVEPDPTAELALPGTSIRLPRRLYERVTNFDFPGEWPAPAGGIVRAPMPFREPESRALADFVVRHPNICLLVNQHSAGGFNILPPVGAGPVPGLPSQDQGVHAMIADVARETSGFPSIAHEMAGQPGLALWAWHAFGIWSVVTELWDAGRAAGAGGTDIDAPVDEQRELALLRWNDRELEGRGFVDWRPFAHPQLGEVELGGWDETWLTLNPPPRYLEEECRRQADFIERLASLAPRVGIQHASVERLGEDLYAVRAEIRNHGWLATDLSRWARTHELAGPVEATLESAEPVIGPSTVSIGQLDGYAQAEGPYPPSNVRQVEWVARVPSGSTTVTLSVSSPRAGTHRLEIPLCSR